MNKLTISFETASGVHSFTVLDAPRDLYDAAVSGVDASRSDVPRRGNSFYMQAEAWQSICGSVAQVHGARMRTDIDVAEKVRDMADALVSRGPGPWARVSVDVWRRIKTAVNHAYPSEVERSADDIAKLIEHGFKND